MDDPMFQSTNKTEESGASSQDGTRESTPQIIILREDGQGVRSRHTGRWFVLALVACVALVVIWMTSVSTTLSHLQTTATQNGQILSAQQAHLSAISQTLSGLSQSLANLSREMASFFTTVIGLLSRHLG